MEVTMEIRIKSIHFDATEKLQEFINKKVEKLQKSYEDIQKVEVQLKVEKPAAALNKTTSLTVTAPGNTLFVEKTCDTFEEGVDLCLDAMKVQLTKFKEKQRKL
jgi:putative sigma-54 modulation protein